MLKKSQIPHTITHREAIAISRAGKHPKFAIRLVIGGFLFGVIIASIGLYLSALISTWTGLTGLSATVFQLITAPIFTLIIFAKYNETVMVWFIRREIRKQRQRKRIQKNLNAVSLPDSL